MKRIVLGLAVAATLCTSSINVRAYGCYYGGPCFWPFWPLALGAGIALGSSIAYSHSYSSPTYVYAPPPYAYSYSQPANTYSSSTSVQPASVQHDSSAPAPVYAEVSPWIPSTPGAGHWVPDPSPYTYGAARAPVVVETVTVTNSIGGVPVYTVSR